MKKKIYIPVSIIVFIAIGIFTYLQLADDKDEWMCEKGQWVKHGDPFLETPPSRTCNIDGTVGSFLTIDRVFRYYIEKLDDTTKERYATKQACIIVEAESDVDFVEVSLTPEHGTVQLIVNEGKEKIGSEPETYALGGFDSNCRPYIDPAWPINENLKVKRAYIYYPPGDNLINSDTVHVRIKNQEGLESESKVLIDLEDPSNY